MNLKTEGIVLSSLKYSDSQIISHIFTKEKGTVPFIIRLSNSKKSNKKKSAFQSLNFLDLEFLYKEKTSVQTLKDWNLEYLFHTIPYDDIKRTIAVFVAEILTKVLRTEAANPELFRFLHNSIQYFDLQENQFSNFHIWFLIQLSKHIGFGPTLKKGFYFDLVEGQFSQTKPHHCNYIEKELLGTFSQLLSIGLPDYPLIKIDRETRQILLQKIIDFYSVRYSECSAIKSLSVLKDIFD
jgi:DNA repair protein RecO (recombination protein O)